MIAILRSNAIAVDTRGNLYVTESYGKTVRKITPAGVVTTLAGTPGSTMGMVDGIGADASFADLQGIAVDPAGNVYVSDANVIRRITSVGEVSTVAGVPGTRGILLGDLPGSLSSPKGLSFIAPNRLAIAEENSVIIRDPRSRDRHCRENPRRARQIPHAVASVVRKPVISGVCISVRILPYTGADGSRLQSHSYHLCSFQMPGLKSP